MNSSSEISRKFGSIQVEFAHEQKLGGDYSSFFKPSTWNHLDLDRLNLYRNNLYQNNFVLKQMVTTLGIYQRALLSLVINSKLLVILNCVKICSRELSIATVYGQVNWRTSHLKFCHPSHLFKAVAFNTWLWCLCIYFLISRFIRKVPGFLREFTFQHKTTKYGHLMPNSLKKKFGKRQFL